MVGVEQDLLVLTVDQRGSRDTPDLVPEVIAALEGVPLHRRFERTAGDELQGVQTDPGALPVVLETLLRAGSWNIGIGAGPVEHPLPESARAGRGAAYVRAREAVTTAKASPWHTREVGDGAAARDLESAIWLWAALLDRRTPKGWEVTDLVDSGLTYEEAGRRLGISQSAVSQRAQAAGLAEGRRARELVGHLGAGLLGQEV